MATLNAVMTDVSYPQSMTRLHNFPPANDYPRTYWQRDGGSGKDTEQHTRDASRKKLYGTLFACLVCLMGPGSATLHASLTVLGRFFDLSGMYLMASFMVMYSATRKFPGLRFSVFLTMYSILVFVVILVLLLSCDRSLK